MGDRAFQIWKLVMAIIFLWSAIHLIRDVMQVVGMHNILTEVANRSHKWCEPLGSLCGYTSFPPEIFNLIVIPIIWQRKEMSILGWLVIASPTVVLLMWLFP